MFSHLEVPKRNELHHWADYVELLCLTDPDLIYSAGRLADVVASESDFTAAETDLTGAISTDSTDDDEYLEGAFDGAADATRQEALSDALGTEFEDVSLDIDDSRILEKADKFFGRDAETDDRDYLWRLRIFRLLESRQAALEDAYPFEVNRQQLTLKRRDMSNTRLLYVFFLCCSALRYHPRVTQAALTSAFESMSLYSLRAMLPSPWIVDPYGTAKGLERSRFKGGNFKKIKALSRVLNGALLVKKHNFHPRDTADNGLDLVAWLPQADRAKGVPAVFAQCACGERWESKQLESSYSRWKEFIHLASEPTTVTFIPHYFRTVGDEWYAEADVSSMLVDRLRAMRLLRGHRPAGTVIGLAKSAWAYQRVLV